MGVGAKMKLPKIDVSKTYMFLITFCSDLGARGPFSDDSFALAIKVSKPSRRNGGILMASGRVSDLGGRNYY